MIRVKTIRIEIILPHKYIRIPVMPMDSPSVPTIASQHPFGADLNWLLHRVGYALGSAHDAVARRHHLTVRTYVVLSSIVRSPGSNQFELAASLGLDKTTMTASMDRLEQAGLVIRRPSARDRRARVAEATADGETVATLIRDEIAERQQALLSDNAGVDTAELVAALQRLAFGRFVSQAPGAGSCM